MNKIIFTPLIGKLAHLKPFSLTRKVQDFRIGGLTIREKWERILQIPSVDLPGSQLRSAKESNYRGDTGDYLIAGNLLPNQLLVGLVKKMKPGDAIVNAEGKLLVQRVSQSSLQKGKLAPKMITYQDKPTLVSFFFQLHQLNKEAILFDFDLITRRRKSAPIDKSNGVSSPDNIFIEKGARVKHAFLNAEDGPIYIGKNANIMEGSCLKGPVFVGEGAVLKMGAKIYGATAIGPGCVVGGEVKNSSFWGYSNKAHDGYIGDAVVGEWCNLGAGTSCSNLKNNLGDISFQGVNSSLTRGLKKCGVVMGDFSRTAINTAINTGTVIGVSAHVFGNGLTPKNIPDFSWGFDGKNKYELKKALLDANAWKELKGQALSTEEKKTLIQLYNKKIK